MDANDDLIGGAVAELRAEGVVIEEYATMDDAMQKRILCAVMEDLVATKAMVKTEKAAHEALGVQCRGAEESLERAEMKRAEHDRQKKLVKRNKQGQERAERSGIRAATDAVEHAKARPTMTKWERRAVWRMCWQHVEEVSQTRLPGCHAAAHFGFIGVIDEHETEASDRLTLQDAAAMGCTPGFRAVVGKLKTAAARAEQAMEEGVADLKSDDEADSDHSESDQMRSLSGAGAQFEPNNRPWLADHMRACRMN